MKNESSIFKILSSKLSVNSKLYLILRTKFVLSILLISLLPSVIFISAVYQRSRDNLRENALSLTAQNAAVISIEIDRYFDKIGQFTRSLSSPLEKSYIEREVFNSGLSGIYSLSGGESAALYNYKNSELYAAADLFDEKVKVLEKLQNPSVITGTEIRFYKNGNYEYVVSSVNAHKDPETGEITGLAVIDFNYGYFSNLINKLSLKAYPNGELYITNRENVIMFCKNQGLLTTQAGNFTAAADGMQVFVHNMDLSGKQWKATYLIPDGDIYKSLFLSHSLASVILACILGILILSFIITSILLKPLNGLTSALSSNNRTGFPSPPEEIIPHEDGNENSYSINDLIKKVYHTRLEYKDAQLRALQSQINPHFLYNTLESIRGAALFHGINSIAEMARRLSLFFRYSVSENVLVTIKDEIQNLENYIAIQNFRHDDKFVLAYDISERLLDYKILKLTLQPLVENSIKHGLEMKLEKGSIKIGILDFDNTIRIEIRDDGIGIPLEKVNELNQKLSEDPFNNGGTGSQPQEYPKPGTGIGILNVNSRIVLYFGKHYGIRYKEVQAGTCVEVTLPVIH